MRLLLFGDSHIHPYKTFSEDSEERVSSRVATSLWCLRYLADVSKGVDGVVFLGDLFHVRGVLKVAVFNRVNRVFRDLCSVGKYNILIIGNHDLVSLQGTESSLDTFDGVFAEVKGFGEGKDSFAFVPYRDDPNELVSLLGSLLVDKKIEYVFGHFGVMGASLGSANFASPGVPLEVFDQPQLKGVFLGHFHKYQRFLTPKHQVPVWHIGCLTPQDFGDEGQPGMYGILDTDTGEYKPFSFPVEEVPIFKTVNISEAPTEGSPSIVDSTVRGCFIKLRCRADQKPDQLKEDLLGQGAKGVIVDLVKVFKPLVRANITPGMQTHSLLEGYVSSQVKDEASRPRLLELGKEIVTKVGE